MFSRMRKRRWSADIVSVVFLGILLLVVAEAAHAGGTTTGLISPGYGGAASPPGPGGPAPPPACGTCNDTQLYQDAAGTWDCCGDYCEAKPDTSGQYHCCSTCPAAGDPVSVRTGAVKWTKIDLVILTGSDEMNLDIKRTYHSHRNGAGVMGHNWLFCHDTWIEDKGTEIRYHVSAFAFAVYRKVDTNVYRQRDATITREPDGTYTLRTEKGAVSIFDSTGRRVCVKDRYGKQILAYTFTGAQLTGISAGGTRGVTISYNAAGFISQITDHTGRTILYDYDANDDLVKVTYPGTAEFPAGVDVEYVYSRGFADETLNHNILRIIDGRENIHAQYVYDAADRCVSVTPKVIGNTDGRTTK